MLPTISLGMCHVSCFSNKLKLHFHLSCTSTHSSKVLMRFVVCSSGVRQGTLNMENCVLQCETTGVTVRTSARLTMNKCDLYGSKVSSALQWLHSGKPLWVLLFFLLECCLLKVNLLLYVHITSPTVLLFAGGRCGDLPRQRLHAGW